MKSNDAFPTQTYEKLLYPPESSPTETALLFFAGHGLIKETKLGKEGFLATTEANSQSVYGFSLKNLRELLQRSPVKQFIVFLESCYSGEFLTDFEKVFKEEQRDICFITSARANEEAVAEGLLTQALLETLDCKKRLEDYITSEMLVKYLRKIEDNSRVGQRFVYRVHGESILLSGIRLRYAESQNRLTELAAMLQSSAAADNHAVFHQAKDVHIHGNAVECGCRR